MENDLVSLVLEGDELLLSEWIGNNAQHPDIELVLPSLLGICGANYHSSILFKRLFSFQKVRSLQRCCNIYYQCYFVRTLYELNWKQIEEKLLPEDKMLNVKNDLLVLSQEFRQQMKEELQARLGKM